MRKNKGITLSTLVITIIVLLILAGVTITNLTGNNGIVKKAETAAEKTELAGLEEQVEIAIIRTEQKYRNPNLDNIIEELKNSKIISKENQVDKETGKIETDLGYVIEGKLNDYISKEAIPGKIVGGEENKEYTKNGKAIIPVGFMIVPGLDDVSEGLVISDDEEDSELDLDNKIAKGNQFVWIPVTNEKNYKRNVDYANKNISTTSYTTHEEYLPKEIQEEIQEELNNAEATENKSLEQVKGEINEQKETQIVVDKGGFYISRYEAGVLGNDTLISKKGAIVRTHIGFQSAKENAKTFINNNYVKSAIISGIQWDVTMAFIMRNPLRKDGVGNEYDVTKINNNRHKQGTEKETAGNNETDKVCNIYDLEGNCIEYVAERNTWYGDKYPNNVRGGNFAGPNVAASVRGHHINGIFKDLSFRFILYVM